jgi:hypothetical protein
MGKMLNHFVNVEKIPVYFGGRKKGNNVQTLSFLIGQRMNHINSKTIFCREEEGKKCSDPVLSDRPENESHKLKTVFFVGRKKGKNVQTLSCSLVGKVVPHIWACRNCYEVFTAEADLLNHRKVLVILLKHRLIVMYLCRCFIIILQNVCNLIKDVQKSLFENKTKLRYNILRQKNSSEICSALKL